MLWSGALVTRSNRCVTLHTVGKVVGFPDHNAPCTRHRLRRGATHLKHGSPGPPLTKTVTLPVSPSAVVPPAAILSAYTAISAVALMATPSGTIPVST
jgi:hypothetical protein